MSGTELAAAPLILMVFFILLVIHPAKKPVTTAPRNPAFVLVASTPPTKPAASAAFRLLNKQYILKELS